jgi:hypothetical protein
LPQKRSRISCLSLQSHHGPAKLELSSGRCSLPGGRYLNRCMNAPNLTSMFHPPRLLYASRGRGDRDKRRNQGSVFSPDFHSRLNGVQRSFRRLALIHHPDKNQVPQSYPDTQTAEQTVGGHRGIHSTFCSAATGLRGA